MTQRTANRSTDGPQQPYINFVRSTSTLTSVQQDQQQDETGSERSSELSGECVSQFYESVVLAQSSTTTTTTTSSSLSKLPLQLSKPVINKCATLSKNASLRSQQPEQQQPLKSGDIFRFAQNGKLKECQRWLSQAATTNAQDHDFDVNQRDSYYWTPLMVAACSGHLEIVKLLLDNGADANARCNRGMSALELAKKSRHSRVVRLLSDYLEKPKAKNPPEDAPISMTSTAETPEHQVASFECDSCGIVRGIERIAHETSIEHQLKSGQFSSEQTRSLGYFAHVNRNYKGYQMLLKEGWSGKSGLGAHEEGRRYPIRAQKKPDRAGIGLPQTEPKQAKFDSQQERIQKYKAKHKLLSKQERQRRMEARFRRSFRDDERG